MDPFLTVPDILNMWILRLLCQGSFVLNFVVIRNIHFIIIFLLNDIIDILFHFSNTYVLLYGTSLKSHHFVNSLYFHMSIFRPEGLERDYELPKLVHLITTIEPYQ